MEIDKEALIKKLIQFGAVDWGEVMLEETIIYDSELKWRGAHRFIRLRKSGDAITLSYKEHVKTTVDGTLEIEFGIDDFKKAELLFETLGFVPYRHQQKKRHTFELDGVTVDIDTWPKIPAYVELEGKSEQALKKAAAALGLLWKDAVFKNAGMIIEEIYKIPVTKLRWFTFERFE